MFMIKKGEARGRGKRESVGMGREGRGTGEGGSRGREGEGKEDQRGRGGRHTSERETAQFRGIMGLKWRIKDWCRTDNKKKVL